MSTEILNDKIYSDYKCEGFNIGCEGCYLLDECVMKKLEVGLKCPCRFCLIKGVCKQACNDRKNFLIYDDSAYTRERLNEQF